MKLKDMTENIKTRSAEPLTDDELENVSGGRTVETKTVVVSRPHDIIHNKTWSEYEFRCKKCNEEFKKYFNTGKEAYEYWTRQLKFLCPNCQRMGLEITRFIMHIAYD